MRLAAGRAIDHAADARAAAHFVDAGVAGEAAADRLAARDLLDPLRIGDERAAERDGNGLAVCDCCLRCCWTAEAGRRRSWGTLTCLFSSAAKSRNGASGISSAGTLFAPTAASDNDLRDMQRIGAGRGGPDRYLAAFAVGKPPGKKSSTESRWRSRRAPAPPPSPRAARRARSGRGFPASRRIRRCGGSRTAREIARSDSRARRESSTQSKPAACARCAAAT